eukprot:s497_g7.t1
MAQGKGVQEDVQEDVVEKADAYFKKFEIKSLLTQILIKLGEERPEDPAQAIRAHLEVSELGALGAGAVIQPVPDADEEHDADESLFQDLLRVLVNEKLPGKDRESGEDLSKRMAWAGGFNRSVMECWVPQPSPCCACASVAGAFNALWRLGRGSPSGCTISEVAELMAANLEKLNMQRQRRLERLLGVPEGSMEEFCIALDEELKAKCLSWTGKGEQGVQRQVAMSTARDLLSRRHQEFASNPSKPSSLSMGPTVCGKEAEAADAATEEMVLPKNDIFEALHEMLCGDKAPEGPLDDEEKEQKAQEEEEPEAAELVVNPFEGPNLKQEIWELLSKRRGVLRLRADRPNTAAVGTPALRQAAEQLSLLRTTEKIKTGVVLARMRKPNNLKAAALLAKTDTEADIHRQWCCLKNSFSMPNSVLLFHLTNHYALVFAWREWQEEDEEKICLRRQILTSRRGQRPSAWIDFHEVRRILLGATNYHLLSLQRVGSDDAKPTKAEGGKSGKSGELKAFPDPKNSQDGSQIGSRSDTQNDVTIEN